MSNFPLIKIPQKGSAEEISHSQYESMFDNDGSMYGDYIDGLAKFLGTSDLNLSDLISVLLLDQGLKALFSALNNDTINFCLLIDIVEEEILSQLLASNREILKFELRSKIESEDTFSEYEQIEMQNEGDKKIMLEALEFMGDDLFTIVNNEIVTNYGLFQRSYPQNHLGLGKVQLAFRKLYSGEDFHNDLKESFKQVTRLMNGLRDSSWYGRDGRHLFEEFQTGSYHYDMTRVIDMFSNRIAPDNKTVIIWRLINRNNDVGKASYMLQALAQYFATLE